MDYDHPLLKEQWVDITFDGSADSSAFFEREIAPARTFHVDTIRRPFGLRFLAGLGLGANYDVTLVIRKDGPVNNEFRFPNEPARHKLVDLIGDLYILGRHIKGRVIAKKSGHKLNNIFIGRIQHEMAALAKAKEKIRDRHRSDTENNTPPISVLTGR
jgi:UDP-3-O-acyl-N-acetylglucosamine deacetylase